MPKFPAEFSWWRRGISHRPLISYFRQARETLEPHWKKIGGGVAIAVVVVLAIIYVPAQFDGPPGSEPSGREQVAATNVVEVPDSNQLTKVRKSFGPWQMLLTDNNTNAPNLLMFMGSGSTDVSDWTINFVPEQWLKSQPFSLRNIQISGQQATVTDSYGNSFAVALVQPFMFERDPDNVYLIDEDGSVWSTSFTTALTNRVKA